MWNAEAMSDTWFQPGRFYVVLREDDSLSMRGQRIYVCQQCSKKGKLFRKDVRPFVDNFQKCIQAGKVEFLD